MVRRFLPLVITLLLVSLSISISASGQEEQFGEEPRQKPSDRIAYDRAVAETDPAKKIQLIEQFFVDYPDSSLIADMHQIAAHAYSAINNYDKVVEHASKAIELSDEPPFAMFTLLANAYAEHKEPERAISNARRAIELVARARRPSIFSEAQWENLKANALASNYASLGYCYLQLGKNSKSASERDSCYNKSIEAFNKALQYDNLDDISYWRIGLVYAYKNNAEAAVQNLARAVAIKKLAARPAYATLEQIYRLLNNNRLDGLDAILRSAADEINRFKAGQAKSR